MKKKVIVAMVVLAVISLAVGGCTSTVPQEVYDAVVVERDVAQAEVADLEADLASAQAEIGDLQSDLDVSQAEISGLESNLSTAQLEISNLEAELSDLQGQVASLVAEAWDIAELRYTKLRDRIEFDIEELAPWIELSDKPAWLDAAQVCSITLVDEPPVYEVVCLIKLPDQRMFATLSEDAEVTTMVCRGGSQDYQMTVTRDENGDILKMSMQAGESWSHLDWTFTGGLEYLTAQVSGRLKSFIWSDDPAESVDLFTTLVNWLEAMDKTGGLVAPEDQPMMFLALGELSKSPRAAIVYSTWGEVIRRAAIDIFCGIPASCLS